MIEVPEVCGIVVTYHPDREAIENLSHLAAQVGRLIVVDNGSAVDELQALRTEQGRLGFTLMENGTNLGIATALNQGVRQALADGFAWLLLSDQDSRVTPGFTATMLARAQAGPAGERLAILVPRYIDSRLGRVHAPPTMADANLAAATTSGSLMPASIFAVAGFFDDGLFIDGVDFEYSLRVRALDYTIAECAAAELLHAPGTPTVYALPGVSKAIQVGNYSPVRRYYQERNKVLVARRYGRQFGSFMAGQFLISIKDLVKILLYERDKLRKVKYFLNGWWDGIRGVTGPYRAG